VWCLRLDCSLGHCLRLLLHQIIPISLFPSSSFRSSFLSFPIFDRSVSNKHPESTVKSPTARPTEQDTLPGISPTSQMKKESLFRILSIFRKEDLRTASISCTHNTTLSLTASAARFLFADNPSFHICDASHYFNVENLRCSCFSY
jgi:hypothetical protein